MASADDAAASDETTTAAGPTTEGDPSARDGEPAPGGERTIPGIEHPLAAALCCAGIGSSAVAAVPMFGTNIRGAVMLLALALFGMIGALGSLAVYAVE
ncbi:hypothetical protein BRC60_10645 [Halobacteriales archaeon QH_1_68_42]|nr:MAG: hypothetical protein BRC60_10645 [Halobacteriales archaeon QH_1_68_42]